MIDLKYYEVTGVYADGHRTSELTERLAPDAPVARSIEVIAGKVVKYLLTARGSDAFNPGYGGIAFQSTHINERYMPQFTLEINKDVENCEYDLKNIDRRDNVEGERLFKIYVRDIRYSPRTDPGRVDVYLEIVTTYDNRAVVCIHPGRTDE